MAATMDLCIDLNARLTAHIQRADPFGAIHFVGGKGHQIDREFTQIDRELTYALCGINMEQDATFAAERAHRGDILNHANFIVHVHDRHQNGVIAQCSTQILNRDQTIRGGRQPGDLEAFTFKLQAGINHRFMFGYAGNNVLAARLIKLGRAFNGEVVGFGGTGGKHDFTRVSIHQLCHLITRNVYRFFGLPAKTV